MTIAEMKHHFTHRELGIQGAVGEYAILVPIATVLIRLCIPSYAKKPCANIEGGTVAK